MTFNAIKQAIKDYCLLTSADADTRVGTAINRHYRRITSTLGLDVTRFVTRSTTTTNGVATVSFTEIEKIDRVIDATDSNAIRLLTEVSIHDIRSSQPGTGDPVRYAIQAVDADAITIRLDTLPQTSYSLQADGWTTLSDLSGVQEPVIPESFHDILIWAVIAEEMLKKEKLQLSSMFSQKADELLKDLRFHLADSPTKDTRQAGASAYSSSGSAGGGGGSVGGTAYTQSALLTFDRGAGIVPFAVAQSDAPYVANLGAEFLGNVTTDRLIGRDTAGTGESEQLTVGGGIEFTGSGGIQRSALTGDVTASAGSAATTIATDAVTYAKMQNVSATSRVLGRKTASAGDAEECTLSEVLDFVGSAAQGDVLYRGASSWARLGAGTSGQALTTSGAAANPAWGTLPDAAPCGRLTLTTGVPVTTADVTAATTIYYTPYQGNTIRLYDGSAWAQYTFSELSSSLSGLTANLPYDVWVYSNSGTPALELLAWTNGTTRATALTTQDGVYVKTGATTRRYVGTICITGTTGQCEDSYAKRFVWNAYHRVRRPMRVVETTNTWTYTTATWRQANAAAGNQLALVCGIAGDSVFVVAQANSQQGAATVRVTGIGADSTAAYAGITGTTGTTTSSQTTAYLSTIPAEGYHYYAWLEYSVANDTTTWLGDDGSTVTQSGIAGEWMA